MGGMEGGLGRLEAMRAAAVHVMSEIAEEDAWRKKGHGLRLRDCSKRVWGLAYSAGTYLPDRLEPPGYEFFVTVDPRSNRNEPLS
ncbi:MAG: hypothetical protein NWE76_05645 [Candidatus Bathyarchaeota archaeon]|nr:hypothetical protein [Candidatus Bathyarchaeota archaeon]